MTFYAYRIASRAGAKSMVKHTFKSGDESRLSHTFAIVVFQLCLNLSQSSYSHSTMLKTYQCQLLHDASATRLENIDGAQV